VDWNLDLFRLALHGHDPALDERADDRLAVGGRGGAPQGGDVRSPPANRRSLLRAQDRRRCGEEADVRGLEAFLFSQRALPLPLKRAGHPAVLRLDRLERAEGALGFVTRPLEPLGPVRVPLGPLGLKAPRPPVGSLAEPRAPVP
jgi:hypothetical protein